MMPDVEKSARGRPVKLSVRDKRKIVRLITSGEADTATQVVQKLKDQYSIRVSSHTVRRALKQAGMKAVVKKKRPRLLPRHIKARYEFALAHQHWTEADWRHVVWSDETMVDRLGPDGRNWVWKKRGSALTERHVQGTVKFGGGSLMMWGCMTSHGVGYACRIDGRMDAALYTHVLDEEFLNTIEYYGLERDDVIFQQDNAGVHTAQIVTQWLEDNVITTLKWPAQSPDLNPIEHLWWHLKKRLMQYEEEPSGILELWKRIEVEWDAISQETCLNLIDSMPSRIAAVIGAKGGYTKY
jgi:transposase